MNHSKTGFYHDHNCKKKKYKPKCEFESECGGSEDTNRSKPVVSSHSKLHTQNCKKKKYRSVSVSLRASVEGKRKSESLS